MKHKFNKKLLRALVLFACIASFIGAGARAGMAKTLEIKNQTLSYTKEAITTNNTSLISTTSELKTDDGTALKLTADIDSLKIDSVTFQNNITESTTLAGIILNTVDTDNGFTATISGDTKFTGNSTGADGGAINNDKQIDFKGTTTFGGEEESLGNSAANGGGNFQRWQNQL